MNKREWSGVSRSAEEDLALTSIISDYRILTPVRTVIFMLLSVTVLGVYLFANHSFFPGYPITTPFAEENESFAGHYPPFRMNEQISHAITKDILSGNILTEDSFSQRHPLGFPLLSIPLTIIWKEAGPYYTNAVIMWLSVLFFFLLMLEMLPFYLAFCSALVLAFASPNLFFAASSYPEPAAQLFTVMALLFFLKGMSTGQELLYFALAGLAAGLNLFFQPVMAVIFVLFVAVLLFEHGRWAFSDWIVYTLTGGFLIPLVIFFITNKLFYGSFSGHIFSAHYALGSLMPQVEVNSTAQIFAGTVKLLLDIPHGLVFLMPIILFAPHGFIFIWRYQMKVVFFISVILIIGIILFTAAFINPVPEESIGSRHLIAIMPLFIIPAAFLWEEYRFRKILLLAALLLTVYMSTFSWWAVIPLNYDPFIGPLHDRNARTILLARKDRLNRPVFSSTAEIKERFFRSLDRGDMRVWLLTLDSVSVMQIRGFERTVFEKLAAMCGDPGYDRGRLILSIDPDRGIVLSLADIDIKGKG